MLLPVITSWSLAGKTQHMTGKRPVIPAWKLSRTNFSHTRNRIPSLSVWDYSFRQISPDITKVKRLTENILLCETCCFPCGDEQHLFPHQIPGHFEAYPLMLFMANKVMLKQQTCAYIQHWKFFLGSCSCYGYQSRGWPPSVGEVQSDYTVHCVKMLERPWGCEVGVFHTHCRRIWNQSSLQEIHFNANTVWVFVKQLSLTFILLLRERKSTADWSSGWSKALFAQPS